MNITRHIISHWISDTPQRLIFIILFLGIVVGRAQQPGLLRYGQFQGRLDEYSEKIPETQDLSMESIPLEKVIDPNTYILGPGDQLGIDIVATDNAIFNITVNPTGDILIPTVGIIPVAGVTVSAAREIIQNGVIDEYRNAKVSITLIQIRRFLIQVQGAVQKPGFVEITPFDRLATILEQVDGLHKYADEEDIKIIHRSGDESLVSLKQFIITGDLRHNPTLQEGDIVDIPFMKEYRSDLAIFMTMRETAVMVTGFVRYPGPYRYFPGYSINDYIGMAGGVLDSGTLNKIRIHRGESIQKVEQHNYVLPGDQIYIPENLRSQLTGKVGVIQTITAMGTLYLTFVAATKKR